MKTDQVKPLRRRPKWLQEVGQKIDEGVSPEEAISQLQQEQFAKTAVSKLAIYVKHTTLFFRPFKKAKWEHEMGQLLKELGGDKARLKRVLVAYLTIPHNRWTPVVYSAGGFREKFLRIEYWFHHSDDAQAVAMRNLN